MLMKLWNDDRGAITSMEIVLCATILVVGLIVGLASARDAIVTELADFGGAIGSLNQSYSFDSFTITFGMEPDEYTFVFVGSSFEDAEDSCDTSETGNPNSRCVVLCDSALLICEVGTPVMPAP